MNRPRSERLWLEPFTKDHITSRYLDWLNDKSLMRHSEQRRISHSRESCLAYLATFKDSPNHFWAIMENLDGMGHIGTMTAYVNEPNATADIGVLVGHGQARGRGLGGEAFRLAMDFLFRERGMRKVTAGAMAANLPMLGIMRRAGMVPDGVRTRHFLVDGQEVDLVHMSMFREAYLNHGKR